MMAELWYNHFGKSICHSCVKHIPTYDLAISLIDVYPRELKMYVYTESFTSTFIVASLVIAKNNPPVGCVKHIAWSLLRFLDVGQPIHETLGHYFFSFFSCPMLTPLLLRHHDVSCLNIVARVPKAVFSLFFLIVLLSILLIGELLKNLY